MLLRTIEIGDGPLLKELTLRSVEEAPYAFGGAGTLEEERQAPDAKWDDLAAECGGAVDAWRDRCVGYVMLDGETACAKALGWLSSKTPGLAFMSGVWVDPRYRRQGLGRQMVEATCRWALDKAATRLRLWVDDTNPGGARFYEALGFVATGERRPSGERSTVEEVGYERTLFVA